MGHPPEPWEAIRLGNVDYRSEHDVTIDHCADGTVIESIDKWTAERIVACVNALAGIPTERILQLEPGAIASALDQADHGGATNLDCSYCSINQCLRLPT